MTTKTNTSTKTNTTTDINTDIVNTDTDTNTNTNTNTNQEDTVTTDTTTQKVTPYGAAKLVNAALAEMGIDKKIPSQMMYNYTTARINAGKNPFIELTEDGYIVMASLEIWMAKYVAKLQAKATPATEATEATPATPTEA